MRVTTGVTTHGRKKNLLVKYSITPRSDATQTRRRKKNPIPSSLHACPCARGHANRCPRERQKVSRRKSPASHISHFSTERRNPHFPREFCRAFCEIRDRARRVAPSTANRRNLKRWHGVPRVSFHPCNPLTSNVFRRADNNEPSAFVNSTAFTNPRG